MTDHDAKPELFLARRFDAPVALVWEAWVTPASVVQWLGPSGSTMHVIDGDIRTGSTLRIRMEAPFGTMFTAFNYLEVIPQSRLVYEHCFADEAGELIRPSFFQVWPLKLLTTVILEEDGAGTRVSVRWRPLDASPEEERAFAEQLSSMQSGWTGSFDQLAAYLAD